MKRFWMFLTIVFFCSTVVLSIFLINEGQIAGKVEESIPPKETSELANPNVSQENDEKYLIRTKEDALEIAKIIFKANCPDIHLEDLYIEVAYKSEYNNTPENEKYDYYIVFATPGEGWTGGGPELTINRITGEITDFVEMAK